MRKRSVYIVNGNGQYERLFEGLGYDVVGSLLNTPSLIVFTGGADVTPSMYGARPHPRTYSDPDRDHRERAIFLRSQDRGIPALGICRGGQFLNVMSGGSMHQHTHGHATGINHLIRDSETGEEAMVSSTHHQMMIPSEDAIVLATADVVDWPLGMEQRDIEVVYYPHTNALCFQPHPEFFATDHPCVQYLNRCIEERLFA